MLSSSSTSRPKDDGLGNPGGAVPLRLRRVLPQRRGCEDVVSQTTRQPGPETFEKTHRPTFVTAQDHGGLTPVPQRGEPAAPFGGTFVFWDFAFGAEVLLDLLAKYC